MSTIENLAALLLSISPSLIAILTLIVSFIKIFCFISDISKKIERLFDYDKKELRDSIKSMKENYRILSEDLDQCANRQVEIIQENRELKKKLSLLLNKIEHKRVTIHDEEKEKT